MERNGFPPSPKLSKIAGASGGQSQKFMAWGPGHLPRAQGNGRTPAIAFPKIPVGRG